MSTRPANFRLLLVIIFSLHGIYAEVNHVHVPKDTLCSSSEFFDHAGLACTACTFPKVPTKTATGENALGCTCVGTSLEQSTSCTIDEMEGGMCTGGICSATCSDKSMSASLDQKSCVSCGDDSVDTELRSSFNQAANECTCSNPPPQESDLERVSTRRLVEVYNSTTAMPFRLLCHECPIGTAVITEKIITDTNAAFHVTAGVIYYPDAYTCASCPDPNMYFDTNYNCVCTKGFAIVGEQSVGKQACIQYSPTISSDYSRVSFDVIDHLVDNRPPRRIAVDSIIFAHYYLKAASDCEFFSHDQKSDKLRSCQTLGNLCVMTMYDESSAPCLQFQSVISQKRLSSYHGQEDWKKSMPWLYYIDEPDDITEDRGIKMKMSFSEQKDHEHTLRLKLAKYSVDGEFLGLEDLNNQFLFCQTHHLFASVGKTKDLQWLRFGKNVKHKYQCNLRTLITLDMYFYDLYLIDTGKYSCHGQRQEGECLYPVPTLIRNFVEEDSRPNMNSKKTDEANDRYTRRFFLVDNLSGKSASGLKVIRYASKIVLQTTIKDEDPSQIYPPRLIIEYTDIESKELLDQSRRQSTTNTAHDPTMTLKIEFTMKTTRFWASIKVVLGFVSALTVVIWMLRLHNWQTRNIRIPVEGQDSINIMLFIVHAIMLACHTCVIVFTPFLFGICAYWFIFFKLQDTVFMMLPSDDEFYSFDNEYFFFECLIQILFWAQSIYLTYIIYKQCHTDIFFVDWEHPKRSDISMWRMVMVVNEWNRLQILRKTSVEFSLCSLTFLLISRNMYNNATSQPDLSDDSDGMINIALRFANNIFLWFFVLIVQWLWRFIFYDRYYLEQKSQRFIDLSTIANISLFIMNEPYHGFYLHCRSPYDTFGDCSMEELCEQMKKEALGFTAGRGLDAPGSPAGCQTFQIFVSSVFREQLNKATAMGIQTGSHLSIKRKRTNKSEVVNSKKLQFAKAELSAFLKSFIEQSPSPEREGLRIIVREPVLIEKVFGLGPADLRLRESKCIFYSDEKTWVSDYSFLGTTFLGIEHDLVLHDILCFNFVDLLFDDTSTSIVVVYLIHLLRNFVRSYFGKLNLTKKARIDGRFVE